MSDDEQKIIQLIPAIPGIFAQYIDDNGVFNSPVICFALVEEKGEDGKTRKSVIPMGMDADGIIEECNAATYLLPSPPEEKP